MAAPKKKATLVWYVQNKNNIHFYLSISLWSGVFLIKINCFKKTGVSWKLCFSKFWELFFSSSYPFAHPTKQYTVYYILPNRFRFHHPMKNSNTIVLFFFNECPVIPEIYQWKFETAVIFFVPWLPKIFFEKKPVIFSGVI